MPATRNNNDFKIDNVLCFIYGAKIEYTNDAISDILNVFYCVEEIKKSKELLCEILNTTMPTRNNPDKKNKEIMDLMQLVQTNIDSEEGPTVKFLCDNYKKVPPLGIASLAPIMLQLIDEVKEINNILPNISDIRSEVVNTADTTRSLLIEVTGLKNSIRTCTEQIDLIKNNNNIQSQATGNTEQQLLPYNNNNNHDNETNTNKDEKMINNKFEDSDMHCSKEVLHRQHAAMEWWNMSEGHEFRNQNFSGYRHAEEPGHPEEPARHNIPQSEVPTELEEPGSERRPEAPTELEVPDRRMEGSENQTHNAELPQNSENRDVRNEQHNNMTYRNALIGTHTHDVNNESESRSHNSNSNNNAHFNFNNNIDRSHSHFNSNNNIDRAHSQNQTRFNNYSNNSNEISDRYNNSTMIGNRRFSRDVYTRNEQGRPYNMDRNDDRAFNNGPRRGQGGSHRDEIRGANRNVTSTFKAVRRYMDIFLGRVDKGTIMEDIKLEIKNNFNIDILKIIKLDLGDRLFDAYKITVTPDERAYLLDENNYVKWPEGVVVRKFRNFRQQQTWRAY